jgi:acetolactate decarboxylase
MQQLNLTIPRDLWRILDLHAQHTSQKPEQVIHNAIAEYVQGTQDALYQISTSTALVEGVADGAVDCAELKKYGDLGLGTFEHLDGEMVVVDGCVFQVRSDGSVHEVSDDVLTPFATVARFSPDIDVLLKESPDLSILLAALDRLRPTDNFFFSLRIQGHFDYVRTRALCRMEPGTKLIDAAAVQPEFEFHDVRGTLVGFWSPSYVKTLSIPGYHLHFLTEDRTGGGHLLECSGSDLMVQLQRGTKFHLVLPETKTFLDADLRRDPSADLEQAESFQPERVK